MADFQRFLPDASKFLNKGPGLWVRSGLDPWLLWLILLIMTLGLVVLYSGAGASQAAVDKQLLRYGVAMVVMVLMAQVNLRRWQRWVPILYLLGVLFGVHLVLVIPEEVLRKVF